MRVNKLNTRQTRQRIIESRRAGRTNQEIYFDLRTKSNDRLGIAKLIVTTATDDAVIKYKFLRYLATGMLAISIPIFAYFLWKNKNEPYWGEASILILYSAYVIYCCFHLSYGYSVMNIQLAGLTPLYLAPLFAEAEDSIGFGVWMCYFISIAILPFYLTYKTAPEGFKWGSFNLKKDEKGEYLL